MARLRLIVAGGRDFTDLTAVARVIRSLNSQPTEIVCGEARGADTLGRRWAEGHRCAVKSFVPEWSTKAGGFIRNTQMAEYGDALLAFWDGVSKGTEQMIEEANRLGLYVKVIYYLKSSEKCDRIGGTVTKYTYSEPNLNIGDMYG
tara:strand:+ start:626 stop:1063 length:438 start_codon:yes stop_codon:yes gene_type:complete